MCGLLVNGIFLGGGGGHVLVHSKAEAKTGNSFGGGVNSKFKCFGGMFDTYILRKRCGAK